MEELDLPAKSKKVSGKNENNFAVGCERALCISVKQSYGGEIACSPLRQYSGGEVGVCQESTTVG